MVREPLGFDAKGRPVWAVNEAGKPICGAMRKRGPCQSTARMENGRCRLCGGATPAGPESPHFKHGRYAKETLKREALLSRLSTFGSPSELLDRTIEVLRANVDEGNFTAAKYVFDQLAGAPRTTLVYEISNSDFLEAVAAVTAEFIGPDRYEEWWGRVRGCLEAS